MKYALIRVHLCVSVVSILLLSTAAAAADAKRFAGQHFSGAGDVAYIEMLETSRRMFEPDPRYQNLSMLYEPKWNGLVEGPTWDMWWIQNSYGTTFSWLPFATEPWATFIENSQALWFDKQGDGKRADTNGYVAPDGCLVDAASPTAHYYRQGDGRHAMHDWGMEFTAAGVVMQAELLLVSRDDGRIEKYLPQLERGLNFIETRRDPKTGLYQGGVACNLLAPSFGGYLKPDGTRGLAFHAGLQVTYIAALERVIELEKLAGHTETAAAYQRRLELARSSLHKLTTGEGYFINSIDPDGTKHGVFGAAKHGYFESSVNHDAVALRIAGDEQARKIYAKIASIPQLRPHAFIIPNFPSYDDMYEQPQGLWEFGRWVNGGHWSTCEARMILAYCRLGKFDDVTRSMQQLMKFSKTFRMDNPLVNFGNDVYQPQQPINITYDAFGPPAAAIRGLFEYLYKSDRLILIPHIPPMITQLEQRDPIRFGAKKIYLSTAGTGHITRVTINDNVWTEFTPTEITLPYEAMPAEAKIAITLGYPDSPAISVKVAKEEEESPLSKDVDLRALGLREFRLTLKKLEIGAAYESEHARLAEQAFAVIPLRKKLLAGKQLEALPEPAAAAAEKLYAETAEKLYGGLKAVMAKYKDSADARERQIEGVWQSILK
ncbi:MAG: hypothetical protein QOE14_584 [Humisphaera sp.]|nr:hypothetical protein [Humisphaera sp.]